MKIMKKLEFAGLIIALSSCHLALLTAGQQLTDPSEVNALKAVRSRLVDPLNHLRGWRNGDPCNGTWTGVICTSDSNDGFQHVQELRLLNKNLSGTLAPELGQLRYAKRLNFMWNRISGGIPKEIGNIPALELLLLSGNLISGSLPDELGFLPNLTKFQLDLNNISGSLPTTFSNLKNVKHFHMNNNSISGQFPPELSVLKNLQHILLDNNKLSGYLPPELANMSSLKILQLDNNNFEGTGIPNSYGNMPQLLKLSLRNCNLTGTIPDLSANPKLLYLDLSKNQLTGSIPTNQLYRNIRTIDLSSNQLNGTIPSNFSNLPYLQRLSLQNNLLSGSVPTTIWNSLNRSAVSNLILDFQNNLLSDISGILDPPANVTILLQKNPVCSSSGQRNITQFCGTPNDVIEEPVSFNYSSTDTCNGSCPTSGHYEYVPTIPTCFCALPVGVGLRLRSPSIWEFPPYQADFLNYITGNLKLDLDQMYIDWIAWIRGPRLNMHLKFYPKYSTIYHEFNASEVQAIVDTFAEFKINSSDIYGPYDLINFDLFGAYANATIPSANNGLSKGIVAAIVLGVIFFVASVLLLIMFVFLKLRPRHDHHKLPKDHNVSKTSMKIEGVKKFSYEELELTTSSFSSTTQIGQGGYGKVYKGVLADGTVVAIKRAQQDSLQGEREFYTEIEMLSRVHHRNLVSLIGYCDDELEQMLVYEFMPNGSLHDRLSDRYRGDLSFGTRLHIALGASKGILYLHTEANPPIIHRDIKANNILLDSKFNAKVSDFGISKLAPVPGERGFTTTEFSTNVKGTPGYVDPDYVQTHKLTEKSDVYSLGVVFLELLTGMRPISHDKNIVREVNAACGSGLLFSIIDRSMGQYPSECVKKFMALSLKCTLEVKEGRPSMLEVVRELENISSMLPESELVPSELELSTSEISGSNPSLFNPRTSSYLSFNAPGSNLVSGVIPTIKPR